jgi:hypothetical protein
MKIICKISVNQKVDKIKGKPFALDSAAVLRKLATIIRAEARAAGGIQFNRDQFKASNGMSLQLERTALELVRSVHP